jgi:hypothetical protein
MRLLIALLFLFAPLRPVAAAALCAAGEHASATCERGAAGTGGSSLIAGSLESGALGLCAATAPTVVSTMPVLAPERVTDAVPASALPELRAGTRPAPPNQPPRA